MSQKWNIQDIRPVEKKEPRRRPPAVEHRQKHQGKPEDIPNVTISNGTKKKRSGFVIAVVIFLLIVGGAFAVSALMSGAEVTVYPNNRQPNVNAELTAYPDRRAGELQYELMTLEATGERQVTASGEEEVETQATGFIEIIKTTPGAERLIKNTRFRSPNNLVFRIQESVVVPGAVTDGEGNSVPGTIRAEAFAESAGEEYNLPAGTRFNVPGFEEGGFTELYESIYAENRSAFTGGYNGPRFIIDPAELQTARQSLQMELRDSLLARMGEERPSGYTTFDESVAFTYVELPAVEYGEDLVTIKEQAILQLPLFPEQNFANYIAEVTIPVYEGNDVRIDNVGELAFSYQSSTTSKSNLADLPALGFKLTGEPLIVYEFDEDGLKADVLGAPKTALTQVLGAYPAIDRAEAVVRPFWQGSFPRELNKIKIIEVLKTDEN